MDVKGFMPSLVFFGWLFGGFLFACFWLFFFFPLQVWRLGQACKVHCLSRNEPKGQAAWASSSKQSAAGAQAQLTMIMAQTPPPRQWLG